MRAPSGKVIELETVEGSPRLLYIHNFMDAEEADALREHVLTITDPELKLKLSGVGADGSDEHDAQGQHRAEGCDDAHGARRLQSVARKRQDGLEAAVGPSRRPKLCRRFRFHELQSNLVHPIDRGGGGSGCGSGDFGRRCECDGKRGAMAVLRDAGAIGQG